MSLLVTSDILSSGTSDVEAVVKLLVASEAAGSRGGGALAFYRGRDITMER